MGKVKVIGIGGAGCKLAQQLADKAEGNEEKRNISYVLVDSTSDIAATAANATAIVVGDAQTALREYNSACEMGKAMVETSAARIQKELVGIDMLIVLTGLGGGMGSGGAPVLAKWAREKNILTVAFAVEPCAFEGEKRAENAKLGGMALKQVANAVIDISNEAMLAMLPESGDSALRAFTTVDGLVLQGADAMACTVGVNGVVNADLADIRILLNNAGATYLGIGVGRGKNKVADAVRKATVNPTQPYMFMDAQNVMACFSGGTDMQLDDMSKAAELLHAELPQNANIIIGVDMRPELEGAMMVTVFAANFLEG